MIKDNEKMIGLLDSGLGGLSVYQVLKRCLPTEKVIYVGDTIHAPYGEKTDQQIQQFVFSIIDFMIEKGAKIVVMACNTATAVALEEARSRYAIPILGVIQPGVEAAVATSQNRKIGIIGTEVTIRNKSYEKIIRQIDPSIQVFAKACQNQIVQMMEKGLMKEERLSTLFNPCVRPLQEAGVDTLVLGCTHYPFLKETIQKITGPGITLVNPAEKVVELLQEQLEQKPLGYLPNNPYEDQFYISGDAHLFATVAEQLLKHPLSCYKQIELK